METFTLGKIRIGSIYTTLTAQKQSTNKGNGTPIYRVEGPGLDEPLMMRKKTNEWEVIGLFKQHIDEEVIDEIGEAIEEADAEQFNDADEEDELGRMGFNTETEDGYDWTMEDKN